jgi:hypothetical protein
VRPARIPVSLRVLDQSRDWRRRIFWDRVRIDADTGCWLYTGGVTGAGYARAFFKGRYYSLHRLVWKLTRKRSAGRFRVCHKCDRKTCFRPSHLFKGTDADNLGDMARKDRSAHGERNARAKLTDAQALELLTRFKNGESRTSLSVRFDLSYSHTKNICRGWKWRRVYERVFFLGIPA